MDLEESGLGVLVTIFSVGVNGVENRGEERRSGGVWGGIVGSVVGVWLAGWMVAWVRGGARTGEDAHLKV